MYYASQLNILLPNYCKNVLLEFKGFPINAIGKQLRRYSRVPIIGKYIFLRKEAL